MKLEDFYTYDNSVFATLRNPARDVVSAYQSAARYLDTIQEWVFIEAGMPHTARVIHNLAHEMPVRFDVLGEMLHERHLPVEYPATAEFDEVITDMDDAFELTVKVLDMVNEALEAFRTVTDTPALRAMALKTEELMLQISADHTKLLAMWQMWDKGVSASSFDNWVLHMEEGGL